VRWTVYLEEVLGTMVGFLVGTVWASLLLVYTLVDGSWLEARMRCCRSVGAALRLEAERYVLGSLMEETFFVAFGVIEEDGF
jgi:hypothetical protein